MNDYEHMAQWEQALLETAQAYPYPPTPDLDVSLPQRNVALARPVAARRRAPSWAVALAVVLTVLAMGVLAVPQSRAAILTLVARIGAIRVFVDESQPTATATPLPLLAPPQTATHFAPTPVPLALLAAVPGEPVPLETLASSVEFPVRLPPASGPWGSPDSAVAHRIGSHHLITLIWERDGRPVQTLSQTDIPQLGAKMAGGGQVEAVTIGDLDGMWVAGPHTLQLPIDGGPDQIEMASNVLLWSDGAMTYRIEGDISRDDAIRLAESLSPVAAP
jgi:hypothetical protein